MAELKMMELLCPSGHMIFGLAFDPDKNSESEARTMILTALTVMQVNPWCAVCGSKDLKFQTRDTGAEKMAELIPDYIRKTRADLAARDFYNGLRRGAKNN